MVNGMAVLGWGVGGIEAEAAMLGQPLSMLLPEVIGFKLTGKLKEGVTATDLVLTVVEMLRKRGVVGKFVEFFGPGVLDLSIADRATIGNMAPEYGATCGFFPVDEQTVKYLRDTNRKDDRVKLVAAYAKAQGMYLTATTQDPFFTDILKLDLGKVEPSLAGPKRPQDRVPLKAVKTEFAAAMDNGIQEARCLDKRVPVPGREHDLGNGDVVIAAITSCTNTSNPSVMIGAGLLARKAAAKGLTSKPWVKTSLAPGSQVVGEYLASSGLQKDLDKLGFNLVGYGCTTCIGNSGPLPEEISKAINDNDLVAAAVLSGNRNFEGRVNADVRANYLASPPLVVAYAIAGSMQVDLNKTPLGTDQAGKKVFLKDIWPTTKEIDSFIRKNVTKKVFAKKYANVFKGDANWRKIAVPEGLTYAWDNNSTYVQNPPYFVGLQPRPTRADRCRQRAYSGAVPRLDHDRPYFAGRFDQAGLARRQVSDRSSREADRLQPVWHAARQSRGDDARHLRQYPHQEPDGAGCRRRRDDPLSGRRADADLRRRHALQAGEGPAGGVCGQGIRHRLVARLGCEGYHSARHPRRDHAIVRAHPPLQSGRHGRPPTRVRGGYLLADAWTERQRDRHDPRAWRICGRVRN